MDYMKMDFKNDTDGYIFTQIINAMRITYIISFSFLVLLLLSTLNFVITIGITVRRRLRREVIFVRRVRGG